MKFLRSLLAIVLLVVAAGGIWVYSGVYDIGADVPHWKLTENVLAVLRNRSIEMREKHVTGMPNLKDPALVRLGAQHYREMCTGCHLSPDRHDSEMRQGLYPKPPDLTQFAPDPATAFWIIKHGIKMSAMPAWGKTHDDHKIWAMVAYLQVQPQMSAARYQALSAGGEDDDQDGPAPAPAGSAPAAPGSAAKPAEATSAR